MVNETEGKKTCPAMSGRGGGGGGGISSITQRDFDIGLLYIFLLEISPSEDFGDNLLYILYIGGRSYRWTVTVGGWGWWEGHSTCLYFPHQPLLLLPPRRFLLLLNDKKKTTNFSTSQSRFFRREAVGGATENVSWFESGIFTRCEARRGSLSNGRRPPTHTR